MNRPALQALMLDIKADKIDVVVVYKVDRLSRSLHDFAKMVEVFDRHGVSFVSVTQQFNTTSSMGRLTLNVLLSFAQFEREVTGERIRDKIAASKKKGMWMGGHPPLGYDVADKKLILNAAEAEIVRHIYSRYLALGNVRQLCDELTRQGITSKTRNSAVRPGGSTFTRGALYHLLSNPIYIGQVRFKGTLHPGQHEAIISRELWDSAQQQLAQNKQGVIEHYCRTETGFLQGKLFDAVTGEALVVAHAKKKERRYRYYISQSLKKLPKSESPSGWRLPGLVIEKTIRSIISVMLNNRDMLVDALTSAKIPSHHIPDILTRAQKASEQNRSALDACIARVNLQAEGIDMQLSLSSIMPDSTDVRVRHHVPMQMKRRGNEMRLVVEGGLVSHTAVDATLVKSIACANLWAEELLSGAAKSMTDLAARYGVSDSYVKKIMPLAFLAPDIVEAIIAGKQPAHLTNHMLIRQIDMPLEWEAQQVALGFNAQ